MELMSKADCAELLSRCRATCEQMPPEWKERFLPCLQDADAALTDSDPDALTTAVQTFLSLSKACVDELEERFAAQVRE